MQSLSRPALQCKRQALQASELIHKELQAVKTQVSAAEATVRTKAKILIDAKSQLLVARARQNQSIGFLRALFGRADRPEDIQNARQVEEATATVAQAAEDLAKCSGELDALLARRKDLHNSYPGNVRRAAIRRRARSMF